ncbi:sensor histidine kinase [Streptomyces indicus]|uniref:histidine kinase n=1 Tax=Streptomyces indicus TaxID=417292 RepID=A0A1G9A013_9ACTN|nr:histidine kinase [Streptomyces indicus]SDK20698.1 Histidine kinase [Streptomyces indicus]
MPRILRPLTRAVTYTRWVHLVVGAVPTVIGSFIVGVHTDSVANWLLLGLLPIPIVAAAGLVPAMRLAEGLQARLMLFPGRHARRSEPGEQTSEPVIVARPAQTWRDRGVTALWMVLRLEAGTAMAWLSIQAGATTLSFAGAMVGDDPGADSLIAPQGAHWAHVFLVPLPLIVLGYVAAGAGALMARTALRLLGPSPTDRLAALEERTEQLLEHNRIARELHDSIGHALTVAVVQAGAARAANSPAFTDQALAAIEDTGRAALEDLERVLKVLREPGEPAHRRPTLAEADRLLDSARASGAKVDAEITGPVDRLPGPVTREAYRILQEALTNVLRHAGAVPVSVRISADERRLLLTVTNPLDGSSLGAGSGSGLRGIRERATLLGGRAKAGPDDGEWRLSVDLPVA